MNVRVQLQVPAARPREKAMHTSTLDERVHEGSPEELDRLEVHLQAQLNGRVRNFRLGAGRAGLVIQGRAATYYAKQLAQTLVMTVTTVPIEANQIEVR